MNEIDPDILWYYERGLESGRLAKSSRLEEVRTRRIISTRLGAVPCSVADIGGGPGAYALWLAGQGCSVHLVDPVGLHLEQARAAADEAGLQLAGIHQAHAGKLPFADAEFDAALFLGPLYHITDRDDRIAALREARRVLRPGGVLFAAAIGRYASMVDGFFKGYVANEAFTETMRHVIVDGQHRNPNRASSFFTTSYFHRPEELDAEVREAGFTDVEILMIEGIWTYLPDFDRQWQDERFRSLLLDCMETVESDRSVIGLGGHIMAVGRRPE